jgi:proline dehydrogenase
MNRRINEMIWSAWEAVAKHAGRAYIAGPALDDAISTCRRLCSMGIGGTICSWNVESDSPKQIVDAYTSALAILGNEKMDCYLSVKLPPLGYDWALVNELLEQARRKNTLIHFDSLQPETADRTFSMIALAARSYPHLGCTLPGRWARSIDDADTAVNLGLQVRVVKGQWPDPQDRDMNTREGCLNVIDRLAGRARFVAVATHDPELGRTALERLRQSGTPCSLELLYGLPMKPALRVARELNVPVRVYVPFGHGWLPYSLTQARRNPRVFWWVLRDLIAGGSSLSPKKPSRGILPSAKETPSTTSTSRA